MNTVFGDSSYWIALINPKDDLHAKADQLSKQYQSILTSEMVFAEVAAFFAKRKHLRWVVVSVIRELRGNIHCEIVPQTHEQFNQAIAHYEEHDDKEWSLVDCSSMLLMKSRRIDEVLSHDLHFQQAQMTSLMR